MSNALNSNSSTLDDNIAKPWYREFWFWFIFGPLIFIILFCGFTVSIAYKNSDDVVTDNYYKSGVMINQTLQQDEKAAALGLEAELNFDAVTHELVMQLKGKETLPKELMLFLDNPMKSANDQHIALVEVTPGNYRGEYSGDLKYSWYLALVPTNDVKQRKTADWLLTGEVNFAKGNKTQLRSRFNSSKTKTEDAAE